MATWLPLAIAAQGSLHVQLLGEYDRGDERYSGSWVYADPLGTEYALLGTRFGTAAYALDGPAAPIELGFIPGPTSNWREITVVGHHAYVVTEGSGDLQGMQVIDLSFLPDSLHLTAVYDSTFTRGHIIQKDLYAEHPTVFVCGTSSTGGIHILDVSEPAHPVQIGLYDPDYYIHDIHLRGDTLYAAAFYEGQVDILDISDPAQPSWIAALEDPGNNTHSMSTTPDGRYLFLADEQDGLPARIFDLSDLADIEEVAQYSANEESLVHNPYIRGDFAFISHNTEGLRVVDLRDPRVPVEVGYADTYDGPSGGFFGLWSACPYLPSGRIVGGDRTRGLLVWNFEETYAGRFYGKVSDLLTGDALVNARIVIDPPADTLFSGLNGRFQGGELPGLLSLNISADGYLPASLTIDLQEKDSLFLPILLEPELGVATAEASGAGEECRVFWSAMGGHWSLTCPPPLQPVALEVYSLDGRRIYREEDPGHSIERPALGRWPTGWQLVVVWGAGAELLYRGLVWFE